MTTTNIILTVGIVIAVLIGFSAQASHAQNTIPVIRANSRNVSVLDGEHWRKEYWYIMPETQPDYYMIENPKKPHTITFYTDVDTISFDVKFNETKDFIIVLNGKDSCLTRISAIPPKPIRYRKSWNGNANTNDTIPFTLGLDNKTYIKAKINNSRVIDFQFDLGTTACILKESVSEDCKMLWDGSAEMGSVSGSQTVKSSKYNQIQIGNVIWDSVGMFSTQHTNWGSEGLIGNSIMQDKVIEINYDKNILVLHHSLPNLGKEYVKVEMQMRDGVPYIPIVIDNGKTKAKNWFMFDNGYDNCLLVDNEFAKANSLYGSMQVVGNRSNEMNGNTETVLVPRLFIGDYELPAVPIDLQNPNDKKPYDRVIIGNDVLKRFNVVIDYQNNIIYFKPNTLLNEKYNQGSTLRNAILIGAGIVVAIIAGLLVLARR